MIGRLAFILMFLTAIAAGGLSLLNNETAPRIAEIKRLEQERARKHVLEPVGGIYFKRVEFADGFTCWRAYDADSAFVGYAVIARGKGYSSTIETVTGIDTTDEITGIKVTFQQETPGLGTKITEVRHGEHEPWFQRQFEGHHGPTVALKQDRGEIDAITGATISSRAVTESVRDAARALKEHLETAPELAAAGDDEGLSGDEQDFDAPVEESGQYHDEEAELEEYADEEAE